MDFTFTEENEELRQTVRRFLSQDSSEQAVRRAMADPRGYDPQVWSRMAGQLGLPGLVVPERHGGAGLGPVELGIVMEEMGRALLCAPYLSSAVLATLALLHCATEEAQATLLPGLAAGTSLAALAWVEPGRDWEPEAVRMHAEAGGANWRLHGEKTYVVDGHGADVLLVAARAPEGLSLFRVDGDADGVERRSLPTLDLTRKLAHVRFTRALAQRIGAEGDLAGPLQRVLDLAVVALAAEQAGGAQRCLEMSTEYAKTRLQFGRPIGSFQAVKHRCADMLVSVEFARSAAYNAAFHAAAGNAAEIAAAAAMAKSYCSEAYYRVAADTIQVHGGMGFTWEHPAHLYFKRAKSSSLMFGDPVKQRRRLAGLVGI